MSAYYYAYGTLGVLLAAFIPGIIAAGRERRFSKWYLYGILLFPAAFIHSLFLKKPVHKINVIIHDKENPAKVKRKSYSTVAKEKKKITVSPKYIYMVFFSKLIFGAFVAFSVFAVFRTFVYGTDNLRRACVLFAILFSVLLSVVELCRYSRLPRMADEITKRALIMLAFSVVCSLPIFLIKTFLLDKVVEEYQINFATSVCILISLVVFIVLLTRKQQLYYSVFNRFSDYCMLSIFAYAIYAAITLIWMSMSQVRHLTLAVAMPAQILNIEYFSDVTFLGKLSSIYSAALVHLCIAALLFVSGLVCKGNKRKELERRIEYRSKAFRMSRKGILRRHIPAMGRKEAPTPVR